MQKNSSFLWAQSRNFTSNGRPWINYWKHSGAAFKEMRGTCPGPPRALHAKSSLCPPALSRLQRTLRVWIFGTKCFVQLEHQIISSFSVQMMKACQIYFVDLERSAEVSLKGEYNPVQNSVSVMISPNPVQEWSASHTMELPQHPIFTKSRLPLIFKLSHAQFLFFLSGEWDPTHKLVIQLEWEPKSPGTLTQPPTSLFRIK